MRIKTIGSMQTELKESKDSESKKDEARMTSKPALAFYVETLVETRTTSVQMGLSEHAVQHSRSK